MTRQQQRRADAKNGAAYIASGAGILAASMIGLLLIAVIIGYATQGLGYALATVAVIGYLRHRDQQQQRARASARANSATLAQRRASEERQAAEARQRTAAHAANARARREAGF